MFRIVYGHANTISAVYSVYTVHGMKIDYIWLNLQCTTELYWLQHLAMCLAGSNISCCLSVFLLLDHTAKCWITELKVIETAVWQLNSTHIKQGHVDNKA